MDWTLDTPRASTPPASANDEWIDNFNYFEKAFAVSGSSATGGHVFPGIYGSTAGKHIGRAALVYSGSAEDDYQNQMSFAFGGLTVSNTLGASAGDKYQGQRVTATKNFTCKRVQICIRYSGSPPASAVNVALYDNSGGSPGSILAQGTITGITDKAQFLGAILDDTVGVSSGTVYWIVCWVDTIGDGSNNYLITGAQGNLIGGQGDWRYGSDKDLLGGIYGPLIGDTYDMWFKLDSWSSYGFGVGLANIKYSMAFDQVTKSFMYNAGSEGSPPAGWKQCVDFVRKDAAITITNNISFKGAEASANKFVDGRNYYEDGIKLDNTSAFARRLAVAAGSATHNDIIPWPTDPITGETLTPASCESMSWMVSLREADPPSDYVLYYIDTYLVDDGSGYNRKVYARAAYAGPTWFDCDVNYIVLAIRSDV